MWKYQFTCEINVDSFILAFAIDVEKEKYSDFSPAALNKVRDQHSLQASIKFLAFLI